MCRELCTSGSLEACGIFILALAGPSLSLAAPRPLRRILHPHKRASDQHLVWTQIGMLAQSATSAFSVRSQGSAWDAGKGFEPEEPGCCLDKMGKEQAEQPSCQLSAEDAFQGSAFAELELKVRPEARRACEPASVCAGCSGRSLRR